MAEQQEKRVLPLSTYQREIRCPFHHKLLGKYDSRLGVVNVTYYCPLCKREYTFTINAVKE